MTRKHSIRWAAIILVSLLIGFSGNIARSATTFNVNSTLDTSDTDISDGVCDSDAGTEGNQCTLRAAIEQANELAGEDAIVLQATTYAITSSLTITSDIIIQGNDAVIDATNTGGDAFLISSGSAELGNIAIQNAPGYGVNNQSMVTLNDATLSGNLTALNNAAAGTATLSNLTIIDNVEKGIENGGDLMLNGGLIANSGKAGILNYNGMAELINLTISGGQADGLLNGPPGGDVTLINSTLVGNQYNGLDSNFGEIFVSNTIVAGNNGPNCEGIALFTDNGSNLASDESCGTGFGSITPDVHFETTLADNGGPTQTHALIASADNPAIDEAGSCEGTVPTDQRGYDRPQGAACDVGAFELLTAVASIADAGAQTEGDTGTVDYTFNVTLENPTDFPFSLDWAVSGDVNAADFGGVLPSGSVIFGVGEVQQPVTVSVTGDPYIEPDETFTVTLTNALAGIILADDTGEATIQTDDTASVLISTTSLSAAEGGSGGSYNVVLDGKPTSDVTVTATPDSQLDLGVATALELTFTPDNWSEAQTVTVNAVDDSADEGEHTGQITHSISQPGGDQAFDGADAPDVTVTITDNDAVTNTAPTLNAIGNQVGTVGNVVTLNVSASDPDGDSLTFSAVGLPAGLTIDGNTGTISGSLTTAGTFNPAVTVSDGSLQATQAFTWTVNPVPGPLLVNGSFEGDLSSGWEGLFLGSFNRIIPYGPAPDGNRVVVMDGTRDNGVEGVQQRVSYDGSAGDIIALTAMTGGRNMPAGSQIGLRIFLFDANGSRVDTCLALINVSGTVAPRSITCTMEASADFSEILVQMGARRITDGFYGFDMAELTVE